MEKKCQLEERLARFQTAAVAAAAAALGDEKSSGESPEEDQESAYVDPCLSETTDRPCRTCRQL
ncbi:hypothetical protein KSP40_PGU020721 [Platanthera guangdongensis]|uniref:Uncharacterized protein n=1 Tax=Platanthera guangdongensis TaxID=2320717 RepID=A0ABR2MSC9_9ASPA